MGSDALQIGAAASQQSSPLLVIQRQVDELTRLSFIVPWGLTSPYAPPAGVGGSEGSKMREAEATIAVLATPFDAPSQIRPSSVTPRDRSERSDVGERGSFLTCLTLLGLAISAALAESTLDGSLLDPIQAESLNVVLASSAAAVSITSGSVALVQFRSSVDRATLDVGLMMLLLGVGWVAPGLVLPGFWGEAAHLGDAVLLGCAVTLLLGALSVAVGSPVSPKLRIRDHVVVSLACAAGVALAATSANEFWALSSPAAHRHWPEAVSAPLLGITAATFFVVGWLRQRWLLGFAALTLLGMTSSLSLSRRSEAAQVVSEVGVGLIAVVSSVIGLIGVLAEARRRAGVNADRIFDAWEEAQVSRRLAASERQRRQDQLHDLRSGLLGVEAVARSLGPASTRASDAHGVSALLATELQRLREIASDRADEAVIDLRETLTPLIDLRLQRAEPVVLECPTGLELCLDRVLLLDVVHNLLENARRHAPGSPVTVTASVTDGLVRIRVRDRGAGIEPERRAHIFNRGETSHPDGSGIGLDVARRMARELGGDLILDHCTGVGASFSLLLAQPRSRHGHE